LSGGGGVTDSPIFCDFLFWAGGAGGLGGILRNERLDWWAQSPQEMKIGLILAVAHPRSLEVLTDGNERVADERR
jgi:hypothetical protein